MLLITRRTIGWIFTVTIISVGCASQSGSNLAAGNATIQAGKWIKIAGSNESEYYYDPYKTNRTQDGNVETLIAGKNKATGKLLMPSLTVLNCSQKLLKFYKQIAGGDWVLSQDWMAPEKTSVSYDWFSLCNTENADGELVSYLGMTNPPDKPGKWMTYFWVYEKDYKPSVTSGKTFKVIYKENPGGSPYYYYQYTRCSDRKFAYSPKLSTEGLEWKDEAAADSIPGYLTFKACGASANRPKQSGSKSSSPSSSSDMTEAKSKCSELGFKKGSDQFGNCVLKLTK